MSAFEGGKLISIWSSQMCWYRVFGTPDVKVGFLNVISLVSGNQCKCFKSTMVVQLT